MFFTGCSRFELIMHKTNSFESEDILTTGSMKMLGEGFSDIPITDAESASKAAAEVEHNLGYKNAMNDLIEYEDSTIDGETFYRLQQTYKGIPVYGRYVIVVAGETGEARSLSTNVRDLPDEIDMRITVTDDQVLSSVREYAISNWGELHDDLDITPVEKAETVVYDLNEEEEACVAVKIIVENGGEIYELIADGRNGTIKSAVSLVDRNVTIGTDGTTDFPVNFDGNQTYTLGDEENNIYVFYFNGANSDNQFCGSGTYPAVNNGNTIIQTLPVSSVGDNIFGNTIEEQTIQCQKGVDLYQNVRKVIDYYSSVFNQGMPCKELFCGYGDQADAGQNAKARYAFDSEGKLTAALICWGANMPFRPYVLGHEYTHCILTAYDSATYEKDPGINEGLADVFGIFYDIHLRGSIDWKCSEPRNAESPGVNHYPSSIREKNQSGQSDEHAYATVISHSMYLMYQSGEFSLDDLEMLWYKTILRLPKACSYGDLRDCMEQTAVIKYGSGSSELRAIQEAFSETGIISDTYIECNNDFSLKLYDINGDPYDDYIIDISGQINTGFLGLKEEDFSQQITVTSSDPVPLHLENGKYFASVRDCAEYPSEISEKELYLILNVNNKQKETEFECASNFGSDYVAAPGAVLNIVDSEGNSLTDYDVVAESRGKKYEIVEGKLNLKEKNNYRIIMTKRDGNTTYYDMFTIRIKAQGEQTIVRKMKVKPSGVIKDKKNPYIDAIKALLDKYGSLRIVQNNSNWENEVNGLCYLNLIDFTGDGEDELMAVCKNEDEDHYSCFVYQQINNQTTLVFENKQIECNYDFDYETLYISSSKDTGYIIGSGWEGDSEEDRTFYWYKDGAFEPVFRRKISWDSKQEKNITEEESIKVDLFDKDHFDEIWSNHESITLRTYNEYDADDNYFSTNKLQKTIDDTLRKLGLSMKDLPASITFSEEKLNEVALVAIYQCMEKDLDEWIPDIDDKEAFWDAMCFYCDFTYWIYSVDYPRAGEDGQYQVIPNELLKNGAYALYKDFDGNLPTMDDGIWRAKYYDEVSTGITVGDSAPFIVTSEKYQQNDDGTIDGEYVTEYWGDIPAGTYKVHFEPNSHYNEVDADVTYYYCISRVDVLEKPSKNEDSDYEVLSTNGSVDAANYANSTPQELAEVLNLSEQFEDDYVVDFAHEDKTSEDYEYTTILECDKEDLNNAGSWDLYIVNDSTIIVSGVRIGMRKEEIQEIIDITRWIYSDEYIFDEYSSLLTYISKEADNKVLQFIINNDRVEEIHYIRDMGDGE